jgi:uncharacterized protein YigA (DUF484 family)
MGRDQRDKAPDGGSGLEASRRESGTMALDDARVAAYLRQHPDFLADNPSVLDVLRAPARPGLGPRDGVVDLQQAMVERLRRELDALRLERDSLIVTGRGNMNVQQRVHKAVLALLSARSFEHLIETVTTDLTVILDLDAVCLGVEQSHAHLPPMRINGVLHLPPDTVASLFGPSRQVLLRANVAGDPTIFGPAAGLIASDALLRLHISDSTPPALLALGAREPDCFEDGQGTDLLAFLGLTLERIIRAWLELPE